MSTADTSESDFLFALVALQMGFITQERLVACTTKPRKARSRPLSDSLVARGFMKTYQAEAVKAAVEARLRDHHGDPLKTVAAIPVEERFRKTLRGLTTRAGFREALGEEAPPRGEVVPENRYRLGAEIGAGGLGRVVEATDTALGREVAVKLVMDDLPPDLAERFTKEARLTARLEHPNIVPIHDHGVLDEDGQKKTFIAMKRVHGRDLARLLQLLAAGVPAEVRVWTRARLLRLFQDICLGVAFAHSRNVIHRDLKPANVMVGDYGEVLIVDWGLAKEIGAPEPLAATGPARAPRPGATMDGEVLGTPAYMPPEQAEGRISEMDARSDVWSLGAILYEILTLKPPFEGATTSEVISKAKAGRITPPSRPVAGPAEVPGGPEAPSTQFRLRPVPPELSAICLKAMAYRPEERYQSARELHDEVQLFLEGVKEREREHAMAEKHTARAREAIQRERRLRGEAQAAEEEARRLRQETEPRGDKAPLWEAEDRARTLAGDAAEARGDALAALTRALGHEREHRDARRLMAELAWEQFLEAEEAGDEGGQRIHRRMAEQYNEGALDEPLKGDGTLTVDAHRWACACLREGRDVAPGELEAAGYHPFSGRNLESDAPAAGEPRERIRLRVHGAACPRERAIGAGVWIYRYEESGRLSVPVTPSLAPKGPPAPIGDLFSAASPFRPRGDGQYLGTTPARATLPMGSYLVVVARDGSLPALGVATVPRRGSGFLDVTLHDPGAVPDGFVTIPSGPFGYQGDRANPYSGPAEVRELPEWWLARFPVTCREYAEFLNAIPAEEARRRAPRESSDGGTWWPGPPFAVPTAAWLASAPAGLRAEARRLRNVGTDWEEDWPVTGVSWGDALAYCAWKRAKTGWCVTLPPGDVWEKAARGTDRRVYPWGAHFDDRWCNAGGLRSAGAAPEPIGAAPHDESPYGVRGLAGNSRDACLNEVEGDAKGWREFRGGAWMRPQVECRVSDVTPFPARGVNPDFGFRLAIMVRTPS